MDGGEADGDGGAGEEHSGFGDAEGVGEEFGLAGEGEADGLEGFFGDGAGDDGGGVGFAEEAGGFVEGVEGGAGGFWGGFSGGGGGAVADDTVDEVFGEFSGGEGGIDDFRADACGVAEGDENFFHVVDMGGDGVGGKGEGGIRMVVGFIFNAPHFATYYSKSRKVNEGYEGQEVAEVAEGRKAGVVEKESMCKFLLDEW